MQKLIAVDGNSLMHRAFYAIASLTNSDGTPTNAVYGFLRMLLKVLKDENPDYVVVAFDMKGPTFRHKDYAEYKAGRKETPSDLAVQFPLMKQTLTAMKLVICECQGFEADDILGTVACMAEEKGIESILITGDRDALQLVDAHTKVMLTKRGITETAIYDEFTLKDEFGVTPRQMTDVKGLWGDTSDNIPGIPGVGEKTAFKLIQQYGSLENVLQHTGDIANERLKNALCQYETQALLCKKLVTIDRCAPIGLDLAAMKFTYPSLEDVTPAIERLGFRSLLKSFESRGYSQEEKPAAAKQQIKTNKLNKLEDLCKLADSFCGTETVALYIDDTGISLAINEQEQYDIPVHQNLLAEGISWDDAVKAMRPMLESEKPKKVVHDAKKFMAFFDQDNVHVKGIWFDTMIAAYLLNATSGRNRLPDIAEEYLGITDNPRAAAVFGLEILMREKLKNEGISQVFDEIEMPLLHVLFDMERTGFCIEGGILRDIGRDYSQKLDNLAHDIYELAGMEFNINSPKQLGEILFVKLGLAMGKKTKTGYSTDIEVLEKLYDEHPVIEKIIEYRQLTKVKSTYVDGLLSVMDKTTCKVHTTFNQTVTATGRISSTEPNLQNIPIRTELGREIRKAFLSGFDNGLLVAADYSQIELRVLAHISGDPVMIDAFVTEQDIHTRTASEVFDVPIDKVTAAMRSSAKAVNFGIVYGISDFGLGRNLKISRKKAAEYIRKYFEKYAGVKNYMDSIIAETKEKGYVKTLFGRRRYVPELKSSNYSIRSFGERVALNTPIQGTAADIIKIAMIKVHHQLNSQNMKSKLILQVHDELVIDAVPDEVEGIKTILKENMENVMDLCIPLVAQVSWGKSWYDTK